MNDMAAEKLRFSPDVVVIPCEESLLIDGLATDEILSGPIAQSLLSDVIAMLDGTRTREDICTLLSGIPCRYVEEAIDTLCEWGYVCGADCLSRAEPAIPPNVEAFLRRATFARRRSVPRSPLPITELPVLVHSSQKLLPALASFQRLLAAYGMSSECALQPHAGSLDQVNNFSIAILLSDADNHAIWSIRCKNHGPVRPVLRSQVRSDGTFYIGPYINLCVRCLAEMLYCSENSHFAIETDSSCLPEMWMPLLSLEIFHSLYETGYGLTVGQMRRVDAHGDSTRLLVDTITPVGSVVDSPGEPIGAGSGGGRVAPLWFERYIQHDNRHDAAYAAASIDHSGEKNLPKQLHSGRRTNLPSNVLLLSVPVSHAILGISMPSSAVTVENVSALLCLSGGFRSDKTHKLRRWVPTSGNLNSSELYIYCQNVSGIEKGLYYYNPMEHALVQIRAACDEFVHDLPGTASQGSDSAKPSAILFAVGNLHRLSGKYGAFAYKLMHLDAGVVIAQITQAAHAQGLNAYLYPDSLFGNGKVLLQLRAHEHLTAVIALYAGYAEPPACALLPPISGCQLAGQVQSAIRDYSIDDLIESLENDRNNNACIAAKNYPIQKALRPLISLRRAVHRKWIEAHGAQLSLGQVYADRRSVRSYSVKIVRRDILSWVLKLACAADLHRRRLQNSHSIDIETIVIVRQSDIPAGVYLLSAGQFHLIGSGFTKENDEGFVLQKELREAPLLIWFRASIEQASAVSGTSGYREILVRCGAMAHDSLIAANARGLKGVLVGGLRSVEAPSSMGFDLASNVGIIGVCLGYENTPE